jgi:hypothetical protein
MVRERKSMALGIRFFCIGTPARDKMGVAGWECAPGGAMTLEKRCISAFDRDSILPLPTCLVMESWEGALRRGAVLVPDQRARGRQLLRAAVGACFGR